jgi:AraC-like DNA-binding protein
VLLAMAACVIEIFLLYSGYIINCLYLVDFSEAPAFVIGPAFYLMIVSLIRGKVSWKYYLHFISPVVYLLLQLPFLLTPEDVKYNAWIDAYHPGLPLREMDVDYGSARFWLTEHHAELVLVSLFVYIVLGTIETVNAFKRKNESFLNPINPVLQKLRLGVVQMILVTVGILIVKIFKDDDTGDHFFATYISVAVYFMSFRVVRNSLFFKQTTLAEPVKYKSSGIVPEVRDQLLTKLHVHMKEKKPFLQTDFSLPDLAQQLGTSVHALSQVINESLGKNFFEMVAEYRVDESKQLLKDQPNIKVEQIAEQVGYNSKSSFNTAFKKLTGKTPSEFRAS